MMASSEHAALPGSLKIDIDVGLCLTVDHRGQVVRRKKIKQTPKTIRDVGNPPHSVVRPPEFIDMLCIGK